MVRVIRVRNNVNRFQYFLTENEEDAKIMRTDGTSKIHIWSPPPVFIYKPKLQRGNFFNFNSDTLISDSKATDVLYSLFIESGELLPLPYKDDKFTLLNVTECINCLDQENTKWKYKENSNIRLMIEKYAFYVDRFPESCIFKIPETSKSELLIVEGLRDPKDEFRYKVDAADLVGLSFEVVWENN